MNKKRVIVVILLVIVCFVLIFSIKELAKDYGSSRILVSAQTGPEDLHKQLEISNETATLTKIATNQEEYEKMFAYFQISDKAPTVDFGKDVAYFVSIYESGCPYVIDDITIQNKEMAIYVKLKTTILSWFFEVGCNSIANPRTFVIEVEKDTYQQIVRVVLKKDNENTNSATDKQHTNEPKTNQNDEETYDDVRKLAWTFLSEKGWSEQAIGWQSSEVEKAQVTNQYELFDEAYIGKEVLRVSFEEKENVTTGPPVVLVDPITTAVIGYISGE